MFHQSQFYAMLKIRHRASVFYASILPAELRPQSTAPPLKYQKPGIIAHICNLSTEDAETGASLGYREVVS